MDMPGSESNNRKRLQSVANWLIRAHCVTGRKGFSIGFDLRRGWLAPYSETTGYIIPTLYRLSIFTDRSELTEIATSAAGWLVSLQQTNGAIPDFFGHRRHPRTRSPVVFNTGQDLFGLLAAYRSTGDWKFLDSAHRAAKWIERESRQDGLWPDSGFGAKEPASYYTHVTWPLYLIGLESNDQELKACAIRGLEVVRKRVSSNQSVDFWGFRNNGNAYTHTIAYTIEGMLEQGLLMEGVSSPFFATAKKVAFKTLELFEQNNRFAGSYDQNWQGDFSYTCMPGNCQLALIYMRLFCIEGEMRFRDAAFMILDKIIKKQLVGYFVPSCIRGAIPASWPPILGNYMRWLYPNWGAKYLADALAFQAQLGNLLSPNKTRGDYSSLWDQFPG